ncbi:MAG: ATP-dependent helicase, partial [Saprospiraceae bacterium]|nr:ATP-dependent helicase [Saprospiraceae bacterium]
AITFINGKDRGRFRRIEDLIEMKIRRLPLPAELANATPRASSGDGDRRGRRGGGRSGRKRGGKRGDKGQSDRRKG